MKKKLLALLLAATMVATAAGCSQNGGSGASSGAESEVSQSSGESQEPSGEVVTLRMGGWGISRMSMRLELSGWRKPSALT